MTDHTSEFDADQICRESAVRRVELHAELPSTNDLALELAAASPTDDLPLLVLAVRQSGGRGRGPNRWWAVEGALTFSLLIDTQDLQLQPRLWPRISLATGIAVADTVIAQLPADQAARHDVRVKWPNDVFVGGRKIAGILTENAARQPHRLVIGIGLNVNNSWRDAPEQLREIGTSLTDIVSEPCAPQRVLVALLQRLHTVITEVAQDTLPLTECWRQRCMLEGKTVTVEVSGSRSTGVCQGIDDDGALLLQNEGGMQRCVAGTVVGIH